jgi:hypothetical protein
VYDNVGESERAKRVGYCVCGSRRRVEREERKKKIIKINEKKNIFVLRPAINFFLFISV